MCRPAAKGTDEVGPSLPTSCSRTGAGVGMPLLDQGKMRLDPDIKDRSGAPLRSLPL